MSHQSSTIEDRASPAPQQRPPRTGGLALARRERDFAVQLIQHLAVPAFVLGADDVLGTREHWRAFYDSPRPCLADLLLSGDGQALETLYPQRLARDSLSGRLSAETWCTMPRLGARRYLALDAGPILSPDGRVMAVIETLRDMTAQRETQDQLERLVCRDWLTGLANRRQFDESLAEANRRALRDGSSFALLMIDIDHFKLYNDSEGHLRGDDCLRRIAVVLQTEMLRGGDIVARYGGEEFTAILPQTDAAGGAAVAMRLIEAVRAEAIPHGAMGPAGIVTVSIGVTATPGTTGPVDRLVAEADAALYAAKRAGRDRLMIAPAV